MFEFLSFKRRPVDPMTDLHSMTQWMKELPLGDMYAANEQVVKTLREFNAQKLPATKDRIAALFLLDEGAQEFLQGLWNQYLLNPRMSRSIESRLWNAVFNYFQEILHAYHGLLMEYVAHPAGSKIAHHLPLITARAVNYFALDAKWCYFRYERINPKLWKRIHNLYHLAEYEEFDRRPLKLYEQDEGGTSVAHLYLRALMLDVLNTGSLLPRQIDLVDRWLAMFARDLVLEKDFKPARHTFFVDLTETRGARRVRRVEPGDNKRYWDTFTLKEHIDSIRAELAKGSVPAKLGLTEDCKLPGCLELLDRIAALWSPTAKRSQRAHERRRAMKQIEVVRGIPDICAQVRQDNEQAILRQKGREGESDLTYAELLDVHMYGFVTRRTQVKLGEERLNQFGAQVTHERWVMENESDGGYGALIDVTEDDWVRLGKLVGLKPERKGNWCVAVVRRLAHVNPKQYSVGMEVLSGNPVALMLRAQHKRDTGYTIDGIDAVDVVLPAPALFLKGSSETGQPDSLLLQSAEYALGRELWFNARGFSYNITLGQVLERGDDWLRTSFRVLSRTPVVDQPRV